MPGDGSASDTEAIAGVVAATGAAWWWAVVAGVVVSIPLGWLLSYGATLMLLLGLFFYALFGLVIGAVMYRVGARARPIRSGRIKLGVGIVILLCWGWSLAVEVYDFPHAKAAEALKSVSPLPEGATPAAFKDDVARFVRRTLAERYGGSGPIGYARWQLSGDTLEYPVETMPRPIVLKAVQGRSTWAVRVVLSIVLLVFGVYSQAAPLARKTDRAQPVEPTETP